jgi:hypothetical protein
VASSSSSVVPVVPTGETVVSVDFVVVTVAPGGTATAPTGVATTAVVGVVTVVVVAPVTGLATLVAVATGGTADGVMVVSVDFVVVAVGVETVVLVLECSTVSPAKAGAETARMALTARVAGISFFIDLAPEGFQVF